MNRLFSAILIIILCAINACQQPSNNLRKIDWQASAEGQEELPALIEYDSTAFPYAPKAHRAPQGLLMRYAGKTILRLPIEKIDAVLFYSGLAVDADGSPTAYHPDDIGLDALAHAGYSGNWWALATEDGLRSGTPIIQAETDPAPGYYVSMTSLSSPYMENDDPHKYINASEIPYFVLPGTVRVRTKMALGDIGLIFNIRNKKYSYAIFADTGPEGKLGEGSIALAKALGINESPRTGGVAGDIAYLLFPKSGDGLPKTPEKINKIGTEYFKKWGGLEALQKQINLSSAPVVITPQP